MLKKNTRMAVPPLLARGITRRLAVACATACLSISTVSAAETEAVTPAETSTDFWTRANLLGDMGGLRTALDNRGVTLGLTEISEVLYNASGGLKAGGAYHGLTTLTVGVDTQKAFDWQGGSFNVSFLDIHGRALSPSYLGGLQAASGIEANPGTRLWEVWLQQEFLDGKVDLRVGQQSADQEFMASQYAGTFINAAFGWPAVPSAGMPAGGPAYPLSSLGLRLRARLNDSLTVMGGVYDGNPAGNSAGDPQVANAQGTNFNLQNGALYIVEWQYAINQAVASGPAQTGLPGTYKFGAWYNSQNFADQRYGSDSLSLASPASNGNPAQHQGNYSLYAVADQMVWRPAENSPRSMGLFARAVVAPDDRNGVSFSANVGVTLTAPFEGRDNDTVGLGLAYAKVGSTLRSLDADSAINRVRSRETVLEAVYQYQVTPWWQLLADVQFVHNPGAGQNPNDAAQKMDNAWVWGLRASLTF